LYLVDADDLVSPSNQRFFQPPAISSRGIGVDRVDRPVVISAVGSIRSSGRSERVIEVAEMPVPPVLLVAAARLGVVLVRAGRRRAVDADMEEGVGRSLTGR